MTTGNNLVFDSGDRQLALGLLTISDGTAEAVVAPQLGAGLVSYDLVDEAGRTPLFRACANPSHAQPFELACNLLVPWSNRISGGGFHFAGRFHSLRPNLPGERFPIHGNGFSSAWSTASVAPESVELSLASIGPGPFSYGARATYALGEGALTMGLRLRNLGPEPLPFGLGFHPWLIRTPGMRLQAKAKRVLLESADHLPTREASVSSRPEWNFATPRALPATWINNAFLDWDGWASVFWPERALALDIVADPPLTTCIVYSPAGDCGFFCFEPVSHPVDAHNLPGGPKANGLVILAPHETMSATCLFRPRFLR
jgi:aldose 1-epimerase